MPTPLPSKKDVLLGLLEKTSVLVHLDARRDDVQVPKHLKSNAQLILQLGLNLAVPIKDLEVNDDGVSCTLSFARTPFFCVLPYPAIFAMVSEDGGKAMVWPEDVPAEVARAAEAEARKLGLVKPVEKTEKSDDVVRELPKKTREEKIAVAPQPIDSNANARRAVKPKVARATSSANEGHEGAAKRPEAHGHETRTKRELPPYLRVIK